MRTLNRIPMTNSSSPRRELELPTSQFDRVELAHRSSTSQCNPTSTMSNSIDQPYVNNVELHRPTVYQQCRTPSTNRMSTMSNSIDQPYINNVELHRPMSNSIDQPYINNVELHRPTVYQQCRTPSAVTLYVKSSNVELYRPSRITVTMVPPSTMSNSDTAN